MDKINEEDLKRLQEIADKIGCTVEDLLKKGEPKAIIESYDSNSFGLLKG